MKMTHITDDMDGFVPVPLERFEQLLEIETLYNRAVDELLTDINFDRCAFYFRHQILMMLGHTDSAVKMKEKEKAFESDLEKSVHF